MKYKIIEILKTFTEKETKQFDSFLSSSFFNESQKLIKLYKALLKYYPGFDQDDMTEENLSRKINPNLPYNKSTIKALFFELANSAEEFLKISVFRTKKAEAEDMLREEYFRRNLYKFADHNAKRTLSEIDSENEFTSDYFYNRYRIITDLCNYFKVHTHNSNADFLKKYSDLHCDRAKCLTYLFTNELLKQYNSFLTAKKTFKISEENNFIIKLYREINFEELLKFIISETDNESYSLIFKLQLANYRAFTDLYDDSNYHEYKNLLVRNIQKLNNDDIYNHFIYLIRYCMMKPSASESGFDFRKELFSIYKFILAKKYYKVGVHDYFPVELYRIVLKLGLELKKFKWTLEFIKKFNPKLNSDIKDNIYNYSLAEYYFHKKRFDDAMRYFHKIELNHFMLRVDLKNLMLMTYYELDLYENAISLIDSYKHFLSNTEVLSDIEKRKCRNFIMTVNNLIRYKTSSKPVSKIEIQKNLTNDMHNKDWANERFVMLDNKFTKSA